MDTLCILVHRPPYGRIHAAEAIRHLNGASAYGLKVTAILLGDGVYLAKRSQAPGTTGWTDLSSALHDSLGHADAGYPRLWVDAESLQVGVSRLQP